MASDRNSLIDEMLVALRANIEFLNSHGSSKTYIKNGVYLKDIAEQYLYEFELEFYQDIDEDADIEVRVGSTNSQGKIYALDETTKTIQILVDTNLGSHIAEASLIITNDFLLKKLCERLEEVKKSSSPFSGLAESILNPALVEHGMNNLNRSDLPDYDLNERQLMAINLALGSSTSYIWGPPGTGKTSTIAPLIAQVINEKKSVLLLSHTNVATDRALKQFIRKAKINFGEPENLGRYLRLGKISSELDEYKEDIDVNSVAAKKMKPISEEISRIESIINTNQSKIADSELLLNGLKELENKLSKLNGNERLLSEANEKLRESSSLVSRTEANLARLTAQIDLYQRSNFVKKMLMGTNLEKLMNEKSSYLIQLENNKSAVLSMKQQIISRQDEVDKLKFSIQELKTLTRGSDKSTLEKQTEDSKDENKRLQEQIDELRKKLEEIRLLVISEAQMIATTLTKSYMDKHVLERTYDCVILDEASMAPIPALYFASGLAKERVVIVGDFCQLPPIAQYNVLENSSKTSEQLLLEEKMVNTWLKRDIFDYSQTTNAIKSKQDVSWMCQLNEQYRMHPDIMKIVNHLIYGDFGSKYCLEAGMGTEQKGDTMLKLEPLPNNRVGVIVPDKKHSFPNSTHSGSYYNIYNALLAVELAKQAVESGYTRIGIVTPFRPQANLIQQMILDLKLGKSVVADTVHRFQGEEKEIIIFDTVTSKPTKLTDDQEKGGDDEKLLNVALSRAESKCILIADIEGIKKKHSESSLFRKFIEYCESHDLPIVASTSILSGLESNESEEKWLEKIYKLDDIAKELGDGLLTDQSSFYKYFFKDLLEAEAEVIIDSPFITRRRAEQFLPIFKFLISKGVSIFVITRLPKDQQDFMQYEARTVLSQFENLGVIVLPFKGLPHRKIAMIDRRIFWNGSLNILSQRESQEMMVRTIGAETCKEVLKFLRFDKNVGKELGVNHLEHCDQCTEIGSWFWSDVGRFGPWTFCLTNGHKRGKPPISQDERNVKREALHKKRSQVKATTTDGTPICPDHNVSMVKKHGRFGDFWGCPHYPRCKVIDKFKKSTPQSRNGLFD